MSGRSDPAPRAGHAGRLLAAILPWMRVLPAGFAWWLGGRLGHSYAHSGSRDNRRCREHLARAFPGWDRHAVERCARRCFRHFGRMALWSLSTLHRDPRRLRRGMGLEGAEHLRAAARACRAGLGPVSCSGHFGNWEVLARVMGTLLPVTVLGKRQRDAGIDRLIQRMRTEHGNRQIYQHEGLGPCVRTVRAGRVLATLPDQDVPRLQGCFVPWFGHPAYTPIGPAAVAQMTGAPLQLAFCFAVGRRWVIHWSPQRRFTGADRSANMLAATAWLMAYQEQLVRRFPEQWAWWHKRWRTRPAKRPDAPGAAAYLPPAD